MASCVHCGAALETPLACSKCGELAVRAAAGAAAPFDPFAIFGLPRSMAVDGADLKRRLLRFSRLVHPDYFAARDSNLREAAERASAELNAAHALLADEAARADWLVRAAGGPDERVERALPQAFLMEVLEWNETLEAARATPLQPAAHAALAPLDAQLSARRRRVLDGLHELLTPLPAAGDPRWLLARRELNAERYLDRTLREIAALRVAQSPR